jgi:hypothetical protein
MNELHGSLGGESPTGHASFCRMGGRSTKGPVSCPCLAQLVCVVTTGVWVAHGRRVKPRSVTERSGCQVDRSGARTARPERQVRRTRYMDKKKRRGRHLVAAPCVLVRRDLPGVSSTREGHPSGPRAGATAARRHPRQTTPAVRPCARAPERCRPRSGQAGFRQARG